MCTGRARALLCLLLFALCRKAASSSGVIGRRETCKNEGEPVVLNVDWSSCVRCICKNGFVDCRREQCPPVEDCYVQMPRTDCCHRCKGCWFKGVEHGSHTEWTEGGELARCESGVVTLTHPVCHVPCEHPIRTRHTHYNCSVCNECVVNGQRVSEGRDVTMQWDPCVKCRCLHGGLTCAKRACPVLPCARAQQRTAPGECCPRCTVGQADKMLPMLQSNKPCVLGTDYHAHMSTFKLDPCTDCTCMNGTAVCSRHTCPVATCAKTLPPPSGKCCPVCLQVEEVSSACIYGGITRQDGDTWQIDACRSCECRKGVVQCALESCPSLVCATDQQPKKLAGQCCPKCVDTDGVCTVFGDPHYKTFDGKFYSFQGPCKYQLVADCLNETFSIRISNDARNTTHSSWTRTATLRMGDTKVNLGKKMRVKVNGQRVTFPHIFKNGKIMKSNGTVQLQVDIGIEILWDGEGFLEVTVSSAYKNHLCGLCGDFNSIARDDLRRKDGKLVNDPWKFGTSWRVGGRRACTRRSERPVEPRCTKRAQRLAHRLCRNMARADVFSDCLTKVNPQNYRAACIRDSCGCEGTRCHCAAYQAYARECRRAGAETQGWESAVWCSGVPPMWLVRGVEGKAFRKISEEERLLRSKTANKRTSIAPRGRPPPPIN